MRDNVLRAAPIIGVIMGMIEAQAAKPCHLPARMGSAIRPATPTGYTPSRIEGDTLEVVVVPPGQE